MKKLIIAALIFLVMWFWLRPAPARWRGMPASTDPAQTIDNLPKPFRSGKYLITPLARYSIKAIVLSRCRYRFDAGADVAPLDLALGWGPMSVAGVINELHFSQSGRWYEYSWRNEPPLEEHAISSHSANTHCLPADDNIRRQLLSVRRHDLVALTGFLVEVNGQNGFQRRSSLSREDSGAGACEILWVTSVSRRGL